MEIEEKLLLKPSDFKPSFNDWVVKGVLNPAAVRMPDRRIMLYLRIAESTIPKEGQAMSCPIMSSEK